MSKYKMSKYYNFKEEELVKLLNSIDDNINDRNLHGYLEQSNAVYCSNDQNYTHIVYAYHQDNSPAIMDILHKHNIDICAVPDDWRLRHILSRDSSIVDELNNYGTVCAVWEDSDDE